MLTIAIILLTSILTVNGDCRGVSATPGSILTLDCPSSTIISSINFAAFGAFCNEITYSWCNTGHPSSPCPTSPNGPLWWYCTTSNAASIVSSLCLNKQSCELSASTNQFGSPPLDCQIPGVTWSLYVDYQCAPIHTVNTPVSLTYPPTWVPSADKTSFLAYVSIVTQELLSDRHNRFSKIIQQGINDVFIPYFSQTQRVYSELKKCEGTVKDRNCFNWFDLYYGDPRSTIQLIYEGGSATIGKGDSNGGIIYVTGHFSFASRALMAAVYYDVRKFTGVCSCLDIISCGPEDNQFVSFGGDAYVDLTVTFTLDPYTHQLKSSVTSNNVMLDKWWTGGVPDGCNQENKLTGFLDNYIFHTMEDALKQKSIQKLLNDSPLFVGPLLVPQSLYKDIGNNITLQFGFNVTKLDWNQGSNIINFIWGNTTFFNRTDNTEKIFVPTDRDKSLPVLPDACCSPDLLTEVRISIPTIEDSVWVVCGALTSSHRTVEIAGVKFFGGIILETAPIISVPDHNTTILRGDIADAKLIVTCITKSKNITFLNIEIQNLTLYFKPEFNKTSDAWYISVISADLQNATFKFYSPALPSGSIFNKFGQEVFDRFLPDLDDALSYATLPIPSNFVLPMQTVITTVVRNGTQEYISIKSINNSPNNTNTISKFNSISKSSEGIYIATIFSNYTNDICSLTDIGDSVGVEFLEFDKCISSVYSGNTMIIKNSTGIVLKTSCNTSSCLYCYERIIKKDVCQNSTIIGNICFSDLLSNNPEHIYIMHSDYPCNSNQISGEMILGKYNDSTCINRRKSSFKLYSSINSDMINIDICDILQCNLCNRFNNLKIGNCLDLKNGKSITISTYEHNNLCQNNINNSLSNTSISIILTSLICIFIASSVIIISYKIRRNGFQQVFDNIKNINGIFPICINIIVLILFFIAWSGVFFMPTDATYKNITINDSQIPIINNWQLLGSIIFGILVLLTIIHFTIIILFERNISEKWCYIMLLAPIGIQLTLLMFPPLTGKISFSKIFNMTIPINTDPIYASVLKFESKGLIKLPLSIITEEIIAILDGLICSILIIPKIDEIAIYVLNLLFLGQSVIILLFVVLVLYFYQLSGSGWWILLCYLSKFAINLINYFFPKIPHIQKIKILFITIASALTWWQISYNGLNAMGHYIITQIATMVATVVLVYGLYSLMPTENGMNNTNNETTHLLINETDVTDVTDTHGLKSIILNIKKSKLCIWLKDEQEHSLNPNRRMKKRRLYILIGIIFVFGLNLSALITFAAYQSSPTKMIAALFQSYDINLTFNVDTPQFNEAFQVFFATSIIGIILNVLALFSFIISLYFDTGENRNKKLWKSRLCIFTALILLIISIVLNLFPNYASLIDVKNLLPPCGGELEKDVRNLFNITLNIFFSIVILSKLGIIISSVPLSLIHAAEEILHENPKNELLHSLTIIFGLTGPFIIAFPMMIAVQLANLVSEFEDLPPALIPLVCCFVLLPSLLYVIAVTIHNRYSHKWRMIWYYAFPICLHFALEFAIFCVLLGFNTVISGILSIDFILIFGADCCLVVIILSDALFGALV